MDKRRRRGGRDKDSRRKRKTEGKMGRQCDCSDNDRHTHIEEKMSFWPS